MRTLAILALTLAGCASTHGPLDVITPDELTIGRGSSKMDTHTTGGYIGHNDMYEYDGENEGESTYAALTWDLPSWQGKDGGMDRQTQRNLSLLIDQMVDDEIEAENDDSDSMITLANGAKPPPMWLPFALIGAGIIIVLGFTLFSRRRDQW